MSSSKQSNQNKTLDESAEIKNQFLAKNCHRKYKAKTEQMHRKKPKQHMPNSKVMPMLKGQKCVCVFVCASVSLSLSLCHAVLRW